MSLIIGILLGLIAGYYGRHNAVISWLINVVWSIPTLLLVIAISVVLGKGFWQVFVAVGLTMWVEVARVTRGEVLKIVQMPYIEAVKSLGLSDLRIMIMHPSKYFKSSNCNFSGKLSTSFYLSLD